VFRICVDPLFPPPRSVLAGVKKMPKTRVIPDNLWENNKFELIFDEDRDASSMKIIGSVDEFVIEEDEEEDISSSEGEEVLDLKINMTKILCPN
jgi:hypothetical protein